MIKDKEETPLQNLKKLFDLWLWYIVSLAILLMGVLMIAPRQ